jgi:hypothetical protein
MSCDRTILCLRTSLRFAILLDPVTRLPERPRLFTVAMEAVEVLDQRLWDPTARGSRSEEFVSLVSSSDRPER